MAERYALDTNVLLRLSHRSHPLHEMLSDCMLHLAAKDAELCFTTQNLGEFWNVSTRPVDRNGFGLSIDEAARRFNAVVRKMTLLPETEGIYLVWLQLLQAHEVRGVQVHDAHLAAVLEVNQVTHLLTFNGADFKRFPQIVAVHPQDLVRQG